MKRGHEARAVVMRRHRFEPARLVLGLALLGMAALFLARAAGGEVPLPLLAALLPAALLLTAGVAVSVFGVRRARARASGREDGSWAGEGSGS
ncbi:hypothetical protein RM780_16345 [Streptomyces sp. DSM 44917]|uniref:Integral membrane protein n=1 Tax=Streptomyces boetiae TaxID=3075541 RepID=A0ABU2LAJ8_9ACTN|nr:hypothetical protein [Streptomyces sp. DSM 44917]MDT0308516.1 hypothetical protein [Streptomyces sp. DSM 44917]